MANIISLKLQACAKAARQLMENGNHDPKAEEIAREAHGELWPVGTEEIEWVTRHLSQIKNILTDQEQLSVILVNVNFYSKFHRRKPLSIEACKGKGGVLPMRGSFRAAGLHFVTSENDVIWMASQEKIGDMSAGGIRRVIRNVDLAVKDKLISVPNGQALVRQLKDKI